MEELDSMSLYSKVLAALIGELGAGIPKSLSNFPFSKLAPVQFYVFLLLSELFSFSEKASFPEAM